ncbi:MAG: folate family ECF transporter S component [Longicatena sp.]
MNFAKELFQVPKLIKTSAKQMRKVTSICGSAMMTSLNVVAGTLFIPITPTLRIGFSSVFAAVSGMYYGPVVTGFAGIIADLLKYLIRPEGPYFPGFALNEFLTGMIYGCFFYQKKITLPRVMLARLCITVFINLILTSLWLNMMYQSPLFTSIRLIKNVVMYPVDVAILYGTLKAAQKIKKTA